MAGQGSNGEKVATRPRQLSRAPHSPANIAFDDHPNEKRFSDRIETMTVDSMLAWLQRAQLVAAPVVLVVKN